MPFPITSKYIDRHSWVYTVIECNHQHNIKIPTQHKVLEKQRIRDTVMTASYIFFKNTTELKSINRVKQGHHCTKFSEICSADGKDIDK